MVNDRELITARALAESLDLSVETIWRYTREKKIPYVELGSRQYRYRLSEVIGALTGLTAREEKVGYKIDPEKKYTYQDYLELPDEPGYRFEILEGELIKERSPNVMHQRVSRRLLRILEDYFWQVDPDGEIFGAPLDVTFHDTTVVQPDLFYVSGEQKRIVLDARIDGPPRLVVEILTPSNRRKDRLQKLRIYQKVKVQHYWIADPEERTLECFSLAGNSYARVAAGMDNEIIEHPDFEGLTLDLKELWK